MKFLALVPVAVMMFSSVVNAQSSKSVTIEGKDAEKILVAMSRADKTTYVHNTVSVTVLRNGNVTCTLTGSHGAPSHLEPSYSCEIEL